MGRVRLLVDTCVLLWMLGEPQRLSVPSRPVLESLDSDILVSPVSLFEIATKVRLGKLAHPGPLLTQMEWTLSKLNAELMSLSGPASVLAGQFAVEHRDPFDRLLAAQAMVSRLTLVSPDAAFSQFDGLEVFW